MKGSPMIVSGFSGNEIFVLAEKGWAPGSIVVGNSVQSLGFVGSLSSGLKRLPVAKSKFDAAHQRRPPCGNR